MIIILFRGKHSSHNLTIEFLAKTLLIVCFLAFLGKNIYNFIFLTSENKST